MLLPYYSDESYDRTMQKTVDDDIVGKTVAHDIEEMASLLAKWYSEKHQDGLMVSIAGAWGAGKSTVAWALVNKLKENNELDLIVANENLLPFANINEAIRQFLSEFAADLKAQNIVNIDREIEKFIIDTTPAAEGYEMTMEVGPVSIKRNFSNSQRIKYEERLVRAFSKIQNRGRHVIIVLDDIDRLRPDEVMAVLRMAEKLRTLPGVIVVLPMYRNVVLNAVDKQLEIGEINAGVFLRKLSDYAISIENPIKDLEESFKVALRETLDDPDADRLWGVGDTRKTVTYVDLLWALFVHIAVFGGAVEFAQGETIARKQVTAPSRSKYLNSLMQFMHDTAHNDRAAIKSLGPHPVYDNAGRLSRFGDRWSSLRTSQNGVWKDQLTEFLGYGPAASVVTTHPEVIELLQHQTSIQFADNIKEKERQQHIPIFIEILMSLIDASDNESYVQDNYKHRDVKQLAHIIGYEFKDADLSVRDEDVIAQLFDMTKRIIDIF